MRRENTQRSILSYKRWVGMNLREIRLQAMLLQDHFDKVRISVTNDLEFAPIKSPSYFSVSPNARKIQQPRGSKKKL